MSVRVFITGTSCKSICGSGVEPIWNAMENGVSFLGSQEKGEANRTPRDPRLILESQPYWPDVKPWPDLRKYANGAAFPAVEVAIAATSEANPVIVEKDRAAVVVASGLLFDDVSSILPKVLRPENRKGRGVAEVLYDDLPDYSYIRVIPAQLGQFISLATGYEASTVCVFGESGNGGLGGLAVAMRMIQTREVDRVVVVGVSGRLPPENVLQLSNREYLCRDFGTAKGPFDVDRTGVVLSESAVALVLESESIVGDHLSRSKVELVSCETLTAKDQETSLRGVLSMVLGESHNVSVCFAHASGSLKGDMLEAKVLGSTFDSPITSSKGTIGLGLETSGLIDVLLAIKCLSTQKVPPVGRTFFLDPDLKDQNIVIGDCLDRSLDTVLVTTIDSAANSAGAALIRRAP